MRRDFDDDMLWEGLGKLKSHLRLTSCDLDDELRQKLCAAVRSAEHQIGRVVFKSRFSGIFPFSPEIRLDSPLLAVESVAVDGALLSEGWTALRSSSVVRFDQSVTGDEAEIVWTAGMEQVPDDLMNAILLIASSLFSNPLDSVETLPKASAALLRPYRNYEL